MIKNYDTNIYILLMILNKTSILRDNSYRMVHSKNASNFSMLIIGITESG